MEYFKTLGGAFSHAFERIGEVDDNGNPIKATEQPITEQEYIEYKKSEIRKKIKHFR